MKIEIVNTKVFERSVTSRKDNKNYTFYTQEAYLHVDNSPYPTRCFVPVGGPSAGYPSGWYQLGGDAVVVDNYSSLSLRRNFALVPLPQPLK